jgi:hypothetical protein
MLLLALSPAGCCQTAATVDLARSPSIYRDSVRDVAVHITPERQRLVARHNPGLGPERSDLVAYLVQSEKRYTTALETYRAAGGRLEAGARALDVGGFLGAFPLALARLGMDVTLSEEYGYYEGAFDELRDLLVDEGVQVWDLDLTLPDVAPPGEEFDLLRTWR